ncbi:class I SAM-dependent methyltransferase [Salinispora arenicola]|uniref:class I SAM-dependent methyltransferase n=1 Tax=Salinispora arenicola TaxID=168697 RepID=UPI00207AB7DE|nr:class I SAM-dependent methyltransferase [Salinispora arenicola]MCN0151842.1 methyltransferase domain-containing protein [Salinispora arenicola]
MANLVGTALMNLLYRSPFNPKSTDNPDDALVDLVEGPDALPRGRALDLGCGHGRHSIYLARQGWDVTGIDIVGHAVATARAKAAEAGVSPRLIAGDVTELTQLGVTGSHSLIVDAGCFHGLPSRIRQRYVTAVTGAASPGATLLMLGLARHPVIKGVTADELRQRFRGWELVRAVSVAGDEMLRYGDGSPLLRRAFEKGWFDPWRYQLRRA